MVKLQTNCYGLSVDLLYIWLIVRGMKPQVLIDLQDELADLNKQEIRCRIDEYFDKQIWSLERDEWLKMTEQDKDEFVNKIRS